MTERAILILFALAFGVIAAIILAVALVPMPDRVALAVIGLALAIVAAGPPTFVAMANLATNKLARQEARVDRAEAKDDRAEVKTTLRQSTTIAAEKFDALERKTDGVVEENHKILTVAVASHALQNHDWGVILDRFALMARKVADRPGASEQDRRDADHAEEVAADHRRRQAQVDAMPGTDEEKAGKAPAMPASPPPLAPQPSAPQPGTTVHPLGSPVPPGTVAGVVEGAVPGSVVKKA